MMRWDRTAGSDGDGPLCASHRPPLVETRELFGQAGALVGAVLELVLEMVDGVAQLALLVLQRLELALVLLLEVLLLTRCAAMCINKLLVGALGFARGLLQRAAQLGQLMFAAQVRLAQPAVVAHKLAQHTLSLSLVLQQVRDCLLCLLQPLLHAYK